jgi:hypothetical protein
MTASINASTSSGVVVTSDTSGNLDFQSNGTTIATVSSSGLTSSSTAKAWVSVNVSGTVVASYNVSSVTTLATGVYKVTMTNALTDANYAYIGATNSTAAGDRGTWFGNTNTTDNASVISPTTTAFCYAIRNSSGTLFNEPHSVAVFR